MTIPEHLTAKGQVKSRPPMIEICELLLTNYALKNAAVEFLAFLKESGAIISWYVTNSYKVKYHGIDLISIKMGNGFKNTPNLLHFSENNATVTTPAQLDEARLYLQNKMTRLDEKNRVITSASDKPAKLTKLDKYLIDFPAGEMKDNITKLVTWLREQKMAPQLFSPNSYKVTWKGTRLCYIRFPKPITWEKPDATNDTVTWRIEFVRDGYGYNDAPKNPEKNKMPKPTYIEPFNYDVFLTEDRLKDFMLSGLTKCAGCYACKPGMPIIINGKPYNMCHIAFYNPSGTMISTLCEVLKCRKSYIDVAK